jgi:NADH-quinone oxidoreductase subunit H
LVSYEVALGLGLLAGVMEAGVLSMRGIVQYQVGVHRWILFANGGAMIIPFAVFMIAALAETNRIPFDLPEAESELVAGYHTEFSGFRWALYMLAEWGNVLLVCGTGVTLFLGGWMRPFPSVAFFAYAFDVLVPFGAFAAIAGYCVYRSRRMFYRYESVMLACLALFLLLAGIAFLLPWTQPVLSGLFWFFTKLGFLIYAFIWLRGTLPRVRYDQLMAFGWRYLIPAGLVGLVLNAVIGLL